MGKRAVAWSTQGAERLRAFVNDWTQVEVAKRARVSQQAISSWLNDDIQPRRQAVVNMHRFLGIEPGEWFVRVRKGAKIR